MTGPGADARALDPRALPLAYDAVLERDADGRHRVRYRLPIPYFGFLWAPLVRRRARRVEAAADAGRPLPVLALVALALAVLGAGALALPLRRPLALAACLRPDRRDYRLYRDRARAATAA